LICVVYYIGGLGCDSVLPSLSILTQYVILTYWLLRARVNLHAVLARNTARYKWPLLSDSVSVAVCYLSAGQLSLAAHLRSWLQVSCC